MTDHDLAVGIIGGSGWLGIALARATVATGLVRPENLHLSCRALEAGRAKLPEARWTTNNQAVVDASDVVILSVRPEQFDAVRIDAAGRTLVSVMAAVPADVVAGRTGCAAVVRAMPNAAAEVGASFTPWFAAGPITPDTRRWVQAIFNSCGAAEEVRSEADLDYLGVLAGMGPAFPALLAEAMIRDAIDRGLDPDLARRASVGVLAGAGRLLHASPDPAALVAAYLDYKGVTTTALATVLEGGFHALIGRGLRAAEARTDAMTAMSRASSGGLSPPPEDGTIRA